MNPLLKYLARYKKTLIGALILAAVNQIFPLVTRIGEGGLKLSGGKKRLLAIARGGYDDLLKAGSLYTALWRQQQAQQIL